MSWQTLWPQSFSLEACSTIPPTLLTTSTPTYLTGPPCSPSITLQKTPVSMLLFYINFMLSNLQMMISSPFSEVDAGGGGRHFLALDQGGAASTPDHRGLAARLLYIFHSPFWSLNNFYAPKSHLLHSAHTLDLIRFQSKGPSVFRFFITLCLCRKSLSLQISWRHPPSASLPLWTPLWTTFQRCQNKTLTNIPWMQK